MRAGSVFLLIFIALGAFGCATMPTNGKLANSLITDRASELKGIAKSDKPLTSDQKMIIDHSAMELIAANKTIMDQAKELEKLRVNLQSESKLAGAGRLIYTILGIAGMAIVAFIIAKVKGFF